MGQHCTVICKNIVMIACPLLQLYNFFNDILQGVAGGQDQEFLNSLGIATHDVTRTYMSKAVLESSWATFHTVTTVLTHGRPKTVDPKA